MLVAVDEAHEGPGSRKSRGAAPSWARWTTATLFLLYGFAKLNGSQFTVLESQLARPLGEARGVTLVWHFFGYSAAYGTLIAVTQIGGALLLTFRRTWLLGALVLTPVAVNILLVDVFFGVRGGGLVAAVVANGLLAYMVAPEVRALIPALLVDSGSGSGRAWVGRACLVAVAFAGTWWIANVNNRNPTPADGVWVAAKGTTPPLDRVARVFFERNRAHLAVVEDTTGAYRYRHFAVSDDDTIRIWQTWLRRGELVYRGSLRDPGGSEPDTVRLHPAADSEARLVLVRREP